MLSPRSISVISDADDVDNEDGAQKPCSLTKSEESNVLLSSNESPGLAWGEQKDQVRIVEEDQTSSKEQIRLAVATETCSFWPSAKQLKDARQVTHADVSVRDFARCGVARCGSELWDSMSGWTGEVQVLLNSLDEDFRVDLCSLFNYTDAELESGHINTCWRFGRWPRMDQRSTLLSRAPCEAIDLDEGKLCQWSRSL